MRIRSVTSIAPLRHSLGGTRWQMDLFMWEYLITFVVITIAISLSDALTPPVIRLASMPQSILLYSIGLQSLLLSLVHHFAPHQKMPFRISSLPKGSLIAPATLSIIEDIVAVDGGGGQAYRLALMSRFDVSPIFRQLLWQMNLFWGAGATGCAIVITLIVFLVKNSDVGFAIGWSLPWAWAAVWTFITIPWVQRSLIVEKQVWQQSSVSAAA
jgi:hypothetical protein